MDFINMSKMCLAEGNPPANRRHLVFPTFNMKMDERMEIRVNETVLLQ